MKFLLVLSLLFLTSCKYYGRWDVKEDLTFKTKSGTLVVPAQAYNGYVGAKKTKFTFIFKDKQNKDKRIEIKVPKEKFKGSNEKFQVSGQDIGQLYDFVGTSHTESESYEQQCESMCEDSLGNIVSCFPAAYYDCTTTVTTSYLTFKMVDPATQSVKATFSGSISSSTTASEYDDNGYGFGTGSGYGSNWP